MAFGDMFSSMKSKVESAFNRFFYPESEVVGNHSPRAGQAKQNDLPPRQTYQAEPQPSYAVPPMQQQPLQGMQQNAVPPYGQDMQNMYQNPCQPNPYPPQQQNAFTPPMQNSQPAQKPVQDGNVVYLPNAQNAPIQDNPVMATRVINARGVSDCYSAITQLRAGDMVILVLESITDPMEMRHYVDMLSGACYSLRATITKLSRHGAYLICPASVKVFVDSATNQLNSAAARAPRAPQQPVQQQPRNAYNNYQPNQNPYQQQPAQDPYQQQRRSMENNPQTPYFSRSVTPDAAVSATTEKQIYNGYMPDMPMENAQ